MNNKKEIQTITYTLDDISKVLEDVLDKIELKEVIKRFKRLKYDKDTEVTLEALKYLGVSKNDKKSLYNEQLKNEYKRYYNTATTLPF